MSNLKVWIDGACEPRNPGGTASYGLVVKNGENVILRGYHAISSGPAMSNNVAEYCGLLAFLKWYKDYPEKGVVEVYSDSKLVINQMGGLWQAREGLYFDYFKECRGLVAEFQPPTQFRFLWVPREENTEADKLSKLALTKLGVRINDPNEP